MPTILIIALILLVVIAIALAALKAILGGGNQSKSPDLYYLRKSLFSPAERSFLGVLESLSFDEITIASKVRLADVLGVKKGLERGDWQRAFNRISSKHVDFLFIQKSDGKPILGIELDDRSHEEEDRVSRDNFIDTVFASAGLPILHIPAKKTYNRNELLTNIEEAIRQNENKIRD